MKINQPSDLLFVDSDTPKEWSLAVQNPELAKEWHPSKNGDLKAEDFTPGSGRSVWWRNSEYEPFKGRICDEVQKFKSRKMTALRNVG